MLFSRSHKLLKLSSIQARLLVQLTQLATTTTATQSARSAVLFSVIKQYKAMAIQLRILVLGLCNLTLRFNALVTSKFMMRTLACISGFGRTTASVAQAGNRSVIQ